MASVPSVKLPSGADMPMIGLGTWKSKPGQVEEAVKCALDLGYRHIDCAFVYGNEAEVGNALQEKISSGSIKRDEIFLVSKLWNSYHAPSDVEVGLRKSLTNLKVDYLDLFLIHWPMAFQGGGENFPKDKDGKIIYADIDIMDTWKALEQCVDKGLIKDIGLSNYNAAQIQRVMKEGRIKPATNQVEVHPYFANDKLVQCCQGVGVPITAYSPLASADRPWAAPGEPVLLEDEKIKALAARLGKTPAQVILRWLLQRNITIIPKSVTPSRIKENFSICDFELSAEDMALIMSFNRDSRLVTPYVSVNGKQVFRDAAAPNFPFLTEF